MSHSHSCRQYNERLLIRIGMQTKTHLSRILFGRFWQKQIVLIKIYLNIIITFNCCSDEWLYFPRDLQLRNHGQDKNYNCFLARHPHSRVQLCISSGQIDSTGLHSQILPSPFPARQKNQAMLVGYSLTTTRVILSLSALGLYPRDTLITTV